MEFIVTETRHRERKEPILLATLEEFVSWCRGQSDCVIIEPLRNGTILLEVYNDYRE